VTISSVTHTCSPAEDLTPKPGWCVAAGSVQEMESCIHQVLEISMKTLTVKLVGLGVFGLIVLAVVVGRCLHRGGTESASPPPAAAARQEAPPAAVRRRRTAPAPQILTSQGAHHDRSCL
jgi:hypothetical protein